MDSAATPSVERQPWGTLPAEKYLLIHWNRQSQERGREQYGRLIQAFLNSGPVTGEGPKATAEPSQITPSEDDIVRILQPWRSEKLRRIATAMYRRSGEELFPIIRLYYDDGDDVFEEMLEDDKESDCFWEEEQQWWRILNDRELFGKSRNSDDWSQILLILPELTSRGISKPSKLTPSKFEMVSNLEEDEREGAIQSWAWLGHMPLAIFDEESIENRTLRLLFLDVNGNIIRHTRVEASELSDIRMASDRGAVDEQVPWCEGTVGELYTQEGRIGRSMYNNGANAAVDEVTDEYGRLGT